MAIGTFIREARDKGQTDETIRDALLAQGWDKALVEMELAGLEVPKSDSNAPTPSHHQQHPSLSPLMAALHHVLLWFFTGSSTITVAAVVASLFGSSVSSQALTSMIAVTLVTFTPYAALFVTYLLTLRRTPGLVPGKVWSIITVCLHSVAAMAAAITLIVALINNGEASIIVSAALILILDAIVIFTYSALGFSRTERKVRAIAAWLHIPLLVVLFGTLTILSVLKLGPAKHDEQLRSDLTAAVQNVHEYAQTHGSLPNSGSDISLPQQIEYKKTGAATYEVCASFKTNSGVAYQSPYSAPSDDYVDEYQFRAPSGYQCFAFQSYELQQNSVRGL